jgi:hypothetical protein
MFEKNARVDEDYRFWRRIIKFLKPFHLFLTNDYF